MSLSAHTSMMNTPKAAYLKANDPSSALAPAMPIPAQIERVQSQIKAVASLAESMHLRLGSVMRPAQATAASSVGISDYPAAETWVGQQMQDHENQLQSVIDSLGNILSRLEL